jgi:hypothetical protein
LEGKLIVECNTSRGIFCFVEKQFYLEDTHVWTKLAALSLGALSLCTIKED